MPDGPFDYSGWIFKLLWMCLAVQPSLTISHIANSSVLLCGTHNIHCVSIHWAQQQFNPFLQSVNPEKTHVAAADMYSAQQPNVLQCVCKSAGRLAGVSELFGDWLRRIVMLMHLPPAPLRGGSSYVLIDWAPASVALFNTGRVGTRFAYSLNEMSSEMTGRPSPNLGWHWAAWTIWCHQENVKPQFPDEKLCTRWLIFPLVGWKFKMKLKWLVYFENSNSLLAQVQNYHW